jgi:hypothetical protein
VVEGARRPTRLDYQNEGIIEGFSDFAYNRVNINEHIIVLKKFKSRIPIFLKHSMDAYSKAVLNSRATCHRQKNF